MSVASIDVSNVRIRTRRADGVVHIDLLLEHPMESGRRLDGQGTLIPSWYLQTVEVLHNEQPIASVSLGPQVSKNPVLSLALRGGVTGDLLKVHWRDNRGENGERSAKLT